MNVPAASRLIFLSDLPKCAIGDKVRFLGWYGARHLYHVALLSWGSVEKYDTTSGTLTLRHDYPDGITVARVNVDHVLEAAHRTDIETGSWVNITGHVMEIKERMRTDEAGRPIRRTKVQVQAILLRSAGSVKLRTYEEALEARKRAELT